MPITSFSFVTERKQKQKKGAKTSWLGGRLSDFRNHSMNSLRSDSISCRFACLANATQESKKIPKIVHPLKTSSCGMFSIFGCALAIASLLWLAPQGQRLCEPYQNFDGDDQSSESTKPLARDWRGVWGVV